MNNHLLRILCLIVFSVLYGCSSGFSEGGISGTGGPPKITVDGQAEKGPFLKRSEVTYRYINEEGETLSEDFSTVTSDDMGSFSLALEDPGVIEIRVRGYHYDEINNQISDGLLTLNGLYIAGNEESQAARVNLLTHIIHDRVLKLIADESLSAGLAITQAEQELLGELESIIPRIGINDFSQLSVYNRENTNENGNAYLLLFSAALYQHTINITPEGGTLSGQLTSVLNELVDDFEDGELDTSSQIIAGLALATQQLDSAEIVSNLEGRSSDVLGETLEVPDFSGFIGQFLITFPAEDALLSETTPVRLEVPSGLKNVNLDLIVDGLVVDTISEAPYEFSWDPYYWSADSTSRHTLLVKASNSVGSEIVSNLVPVSVLASSNNQLSLSSPLDSQIIENSDSVSLQWGLYAGASQYKVQVASTPSFTNILYETTTPNNQFDLSGLDSGDYYWRIKAIDEEEREGAWSETMSFVVAEPLPPEGITSEWRSNGDQYDVTINWQAAEYASRYEIQISADRSFTSDVTSTIVASETETTSLAIGGYFTRIRSISADSIVGDWSESIELPVGLFSHIVNISNNYRDNSNEILMVDDGFVVTSRLEQPSSNPGINISKFHLSGERVWSINYHTSSRGPNSLAKTTDGIIVTGGNVYVDDMGFIIIVSDEGELILEDTFSTAGMTSAITDALELYPGKIVAIQRGRPGSSPMQSSVIFYDIETYSYSTYPINPVDSNDHMAAYKLLKANDGNIVVAGSLQDSTSSFDVDAEGFLVKFDSNDASIIWQKTIPNHDFLDVTSLIQTESGNFVMTGQGWLGGPGVIVLDETGEFITRLTDDNRREPSAINMANDNFRVVSDKSLSDSLILADYENNLEVQHIDLPIRYADFWVRDVRYSEKFGTVIMAEGATIGTSDTRTLIFNVTEDFQYMTQ